jgi:hypothetical protein
MVRVITDIVNSKSKRTAAKEWGILRTLLRSRI